MINSDYIEEINEVSGTITFKANPLSSDGTPLESFSAFSITSGHRAVDLQSENQKVVISFLPYVHLVKIHSFYVNESITVVGSGTDDAVFGESSIQTDPEQDTAWVYTYIETIDEDHVAGKIVRNEEGDPIYNEEDLPEDLKEKVKLTKIYSTLEGLHTDKTATKVTDDSRKFTIDLESWFAGAKPANVGLLLDASGSMIFTSDPLRPININNTEDVDLTPEQKEQLLSKTLSTERYDSNPENDVWEQDIFLTQEEVNWILNPNNTDDNPLSDSAYNYFVFNESDEVKEYAPLGYWDGSLEDDIYDSIIGYYEFEHGDYSDSRRDWLKNSINGREASVVTQINCSELDEADDISFKKADTPTEWSTDHRLSMKKDKGLTVKDLDKATDVEEGLGVLLDVKPSTDSFTISFSVERTNETEPGSGTTSQNYVDLVYVGPLENIKTSEYYRAIRDGSCEGSVAGGTSNSKGRLKGYQNNLSASTQVTNINSVFDARKHVITLVFDDGKITSYSDGAVVDSEQPLNLTDNYIVITGFDHDYDGSDIYIDDVCVFDVALSESDVKKISEYTSGTLTLKKEYLAYNRYREKIALVNNSFIDSLKGGMDGWYYINHDSQWETHYFMDGIETSKTLWGITHSTSEDITYTDSFTVPTGVDAELANTGYTYQPNKNSPSLFYIDENGYLCCFFTRGTHQNQTGTSFVYKKDDEEYIKVEALQRAIGSFASRLDEASPNSQVSAVRYNLDVSTDYDKFVLLDWTTSPSAIQSMMSLNYGTKGTVNGTLSNPEAPNSDGIMQYNYGITGGTTTYVGFKAFNDVLKDRVNPDSNKFLIVFTDGKDTSTPDQQEEIITMAEELKNNGYTIMAVMLTGGTIEFSLDPSSEYQTAKTFILSFIGKSDSTDEEKEKYFFSTAELEDASDEVGDSKETNTIDTLTEIFTNDLLEQIADNLNSYSVQDYIDPRFNLISYRGREYKLDADGIVTIVNVDGTTYARYNLSTGLTLENPPAGINLKPVKDNKDKYYLSVTLSTDIDVDATATTARLYFDADNNMYYLKWVDQTIPGCVPDVKKLSVWNARFTIKAKDDFIGGNAVLTNGNKDNMNWVYSEDDERPSSGIDDYLRVEETNELLSKGFPRVTVNVPPFVSEEEESQTIYMGETLSYETIKQNILEQSRNSTENKNILYYWEYFDRYAKRYGETADYYVNQILTNGSIKIPYYYLPNDSDTNLTGKAEHEGDSLGYLEYKIEQFGPTDGEIHDLEDRQLKLTVSFIPETVENRSSSNDELVKDQYYKWKMTYKPSVGDEQKQETVLVNEHKIDVVSGEIALKVVFDKELKEIIEGKEIKYEIGLYREYNGEEEKVGIFEATYNGIEDIPTDSDGNYILTANIKYLKPYMEENGLPLGKYTVKEPTITASPSYIKYDEIDIVGSKEEYLPDLFKLGTGRATPQEYLGVFEDNTNIILGDDESGTPNIDNRFGIFEIKPIAAFEMPLSGSSSLIMLYIVIMVCIITAIVLQQSVKPKNKKRKCKH